MKRSAHRATPPPRSPAVAPPEPASSSRVPTALILGGIFLLALLLRGLHLGQMSGELYFQVLISDPRQYDRWAQTIVAGNWLGSEVFYQTPLYPYLLAVVYQVCGHSLWAVRILQAVFGATSCVFLARAGARFFSPRVGNIAGLLLAIYPPAIFFDGILQKASLDLLLMTGLLWLIGATQAAPRWWKLALVGALCGLMTLNRENAAILFPVLGLWVVWLAWSAGFRRVLGWGAALVAGAAVTLVPVGARNYYVGGMFALTTSQMGTNFYIGNRNGATGSYETLRPGRGDPKFEAQDARELAEQATGRALRPAEVSQYWLGRSLDDIRADLPRWLRLLAWKWALTWNALELIDSESMYTHARASLVLRVFDPVWNFGVLAALAAAGACWTWRDWRRLWIVYAVIAAMALAVTLFYVFARYRYPLVPPLALLAAAGACGAYDRARHWRDFAPWGSIAGIVASVAVLTFSHVHVARAVDDDAITYLNAGNELVQLNRVDDARRMWERARERAPNLPDVYLSLGKLALLEGDMKLARQLAEQGRALDPRQPMFALNLAVALAEQGDEAQATVLLRGALEQQPLMVSSLTGMARQASALAQHRAAVLLWRTLVEQSPQSAGPLVALSESLRAAGRLPESLDAMRAALRVDPNLLPVANNLAWTLATSRDDAVRNGAEAVALAERVCAATNHQQPDLLDTLAAAYAEVGRYEEAVATCDKAIALTEDTAAREAIEKRRATYAAGQPLRDPP